jgi:hypothetical protein
MYFYFAGAVFVYAGYEEEFVVEIDCCVAMLATGAEEM